MRERGLGEDVVGDALRELGERVRGAGRDDEEVGVPEMWIRIVAGRAARERVERLGGDELLSAARDERNHVVSGLDEQARELTCLVSGNTAGYAKEDASHAPAFCLLKDAASAFGRRT